MVLENLNFQIPNVELRLKLACVQLLLYAENEPVPETMQPIVEIFNQIVDAANENNYDDDDDEREEEDDCDENNNDNNKMNDE